MVTVRRGESDETRAPLKNDCLLTVAREERLLLAAYDEPDVVRP